MIGTKKLLYILPDLAYSTEILPGKKEGEFVVHAFHQINGEFMADDNLLPENLKKLFEKIEPEEYLLVLPDFLFADTIVSVPKTDDLEIATYLRNELLPSIGVSTLTHETQTTILMQRKSESRVQFTALEKEIATTLGVALKGKNVKISNIIPLSWTIKSLISLEPSISVIQIGTMLYLAEHYVGINQTSSANIDDVDHIVETIRTLKGADPNLQTVYLLTNVLTEEKIRDTLAKVLPVQQLTTFGDENLQMPSYIKQIIEAAGKTLAMDAYPLPFFSVIDKPMHTTIIETETPVANVAAVAEEIPSTNNKDEATPPLSPTTEPVLPVDTTIAEEVTSEITQEANANKEDDITISLDEEDVIILPEASQPPEQKKLNLDEATINKTMAEPISVSSVSTPVSSPTQHSTPAAKPDHEIRPDREEKPDHEEKKVESSSMRSNEKPLDKEPTKTDNANTDGVDLSKFAASSQEAPKETKPNKAEKASTASTVKKKGGMGEFFKKLLLFILIFALTIALGLGVGFAVLKFMGNDSEEIVVETPTPTPVATPTPTPEPEESSDSAELVSEEDIDPADYKILVVNATTIAGHAGSTKDALTGEGFTSVTTGNAKGEYEDEGTFVLMPEKDSALIKALENASGLTLTYDEDYDVEDSSGAYDAVIVLAK